MIHTPTAMFFEKFNTASIKSVSENTKHEKEISSICITHA